MEITIRPNAEQILRENNASSGKIEDYAVLSASQDPNFFRWLFAEDFKQDFSRSLTKKHIEVFYGFLAKLGGHTNVVIDYNPTFSR